MKAKALREKREFLNIREMVEFIGEEYKGRVAYRYRINPHDKDQVKITYDEMRNHIRALGTEMISRGLQGKKICVIGKHTYHLIQSYYATMAIGSVWVPLDRDWSQEDLLETVKTAECDFLMCDLDIREKCEFITTELELPPPLFLNGYDADSLLEWRQKGMKKFEKDSSAYFNAPIDVDALAELVFTSGTTGQGKGVMLSQRNFMSDLADVIPFIDFSKRCMNVLPPHHTYGSSVSIYGQNSIGCDIYISSGVKYILKELKEHRPGHLVAVPLYVETFYRRIIKGIEEQGTHDELISRGGLYARLYNNEP
jgi:long-chain acyl-CoA synthetase